MSRRTCSVEGCGRGRYMGGLCAGHNKQKDKGLEFTPLRRYRLDGVHVCTIHVPGSTGCYNNHGCRCPECRAVDSVRRMRGVGKKRQLADTAKLINLLLELAGNGWLAAEVAAASGLSPHYLNRLRRGVKQRVLVDTARRIVVAHRKLSVLKPPRDRMPARRYAIASAARSGWCASPVVSGVGTNRRLQALSALGWLDAEIAHEVGVTPNRVVRLRAAAHVPSFRAEAVSAAYDRMSMRLPPEDSFHRARRTRAKGLGWAVPLMWDDDQIDDPAAVPQNPQPEKRRRGWTKLHVEDVDWMVQTNSSIDEIIMRTGVKRDGVLASCTRHNRRDLIVKLTGVAA